MNTRTAIEYILNESNAAAKSCCDDPAWCAIRKTLCVLARRMGHLGGGWTEAELQEMLMEQVSYFSVYPDSNDDGCREL